MPSLYINIINNNHIYYSICAENRQAKRLKNVGFGVGDIAQKIANRAGDGYEADIKYMGSRVIASAYTATIEARKDNAENQTLKKVVE